jgi:hypothetical protein
VYAALRVAQFKRAKLHTYLNLKRRLQGTKRSEIRDPCGVARRGTEPPHVPARYGNIWYYY